MMNLYREEEKRDRSHRVIVTVLGEDRVGIIAGITGILAEMNVNILDISQTILQNFFTMIMIVDISKATADFNTIAAKLEEKGKEIGVRVTAQHEDVFKFMHRI